MRYGLGAAQYFSSINTLLIASMPLMGRAGFIRLLAEYIGVQIAIITLAVLTIIGICVDIAVEILLGIARVIGRLLNRR